MVAAVSFVASALFHLFIQLFVEQGEGLSLRSVRNKDVVELFGDILDAGRRLGTSGAHDARHLRAARLFHVNVDEFLRGESSKSVRG